MTKSGDVDGIRLDLRNNRFSQPNLVNVPQFPQFARATRVRIFVQTDVSFPFHKTTFDNYWELTSRTIGTDRRYAPLLSISVGLGRKRN